MSRFFFINLSWKIHLNFTYFPVVLLILEEEEYLDRSYSDEGTMESFIKYLCKMNYTKTQAKG